MTKENFNDKINFYKQQAENQKQADIITRQQQQNQEKEKEKLAKIKRQQETQERVRRTKENFAGTGILETFQYIIDNQILVFAEFTESTWVNGFFGEKLIGSKKIIPAKIGYNLDTVHLLYRVDYYSSNEDSGSFSCRRITVDKKEDNKYQLTVPTHKHCPSKTIDNPEKIINEIAHSIAGMEIWDRYSSSGSEYADGQKKLIEYSKELDQSLTGQ